MRRALIAIVAAGLLLSGCATVSSVVSAASQPIPVSTLSDAINADSVVVVGIDTYAKTGKPNTAILAQLKSDADAVHAALKTLEAAQAAGQSLDFTAFNLVLSTLQTYASANGVSL